MKPCSLNLKCCRSDGHEGLCLAPDGTVLLRRRVQWPLAEDEEAARQLAEVLPRWWLHLVGIGAAEAGSPMPLHTDSQETAILLRMLNRWKPE
jgi:hypothetical protein